MSHYHLAFHHHVIHHLHLYPLTFENDLNHWNSLQGRLDVPLRFLWLACLNELAHYISMWIWLLEPAASKNWCRCHGVMLCVSWSLFAVATAVTVLVFCFLGCRSNCSSCLDDTSWKFLFTPRFSSSPFSFLDRVVHPAAFTSDAIRLTCAVVLAKELPDQ